MERTLKAGTFEMLSSQELMEIDGGSETAGRMIMMVGGAVVAGGIMIVAGLAY